MKTKSLSLLLLTLALPLLAAEPPLIRNPLSTNGAVSVPLNLEVPRWNGAAWDFVAMSAGTGGATTNSITSANARAAVTDNDGGGTNFTITVADQTLGFGDLTNHNASEFTTPIQVADQIASSNLVGIVTTNLVVSLSSTNGYFIYTETAGGNTNAFFVMTNAAGNGGNLTNLPFAATTNLVQSLDSTNGYFQYTVTADGNTNAFFVLTNTPGATVFDFGSNQFSGKLNLGQIDPQPPLQTNITSAEILDFPTAVASQIALSNLLTAPMVASQIALSNLLTALQVADQIALSNATFRAQVASQIASSNLLTAPMVASQIALSNLLTASQVADQIALSNLLSASMLDGFTGIVTNLAIAVADLEGYGYSHPQPSFGFRMCWSNSTSGVISSNWTGSQFGVYLSGHWTYTSTFNTPVDGYRPAYVRDADSDFPYNADVWYYDDDLFILRPRGTMAWGAEYFSSSLNWSLVDNLIGPIRVFPVWDDTTTFVKSMTAYTNGLYMTNVDEYISALVDNPMTWPQTNITHNEILDFPTAVASQIALSNLLTAPMVASQIALSNLLTALQVADQIALSNLLTAPQVASQIALSNLLTAPMVADQIALSNATFRAQVALQIASSNLLTAPQVASQIASSNLLGIVNGLLTINASVLMNPAFINGIPRILSFGKSYGVASMYFYEGAATYRMGLGVNLTGLQFFTRNTDAFQWNKGGEFQAAGVNELMRLDAATAKLSVAGTFSGNGSGLTNMPAASMTGTVTNPITSGGAISGVSLAGDGSAITALAVGNITGFQPAVAAVVLANAGTNLMVTPTIGTNLTATFVTNAGGTVTMTMNGITTAQLNVLLGLARVETTNLVTVTDARVPRAGELGEVMQGLRLKSSPLALTTGTAQNVCSVTLGAGTWAVSGNVSVLGTGAGITFTASVESVSLSVSTDGSGSSFNTPAVNGACAAVSQKVFNLSGSTTIYLTIYSTWTGVSYSADGKIIAIRIR